MINVFKGNKLLFFIISLIITLGVCFYVGMNHSIPVLINTMSNFIDNNDMYDFKVNNTMGYTKDDIEEIKNSSNVYNNVEGYIRKDCYLFYGDEKFITSLLSYNNSNEINKLVYLKGSAGKEIDEIVVDAALVDYYDVGDYIEIYDEDLSINKYKITGFVRSPEYISGDKGNSDLNLGNVKYFILINEEAFVNKGLYNYINIKINNNYSSYSDEYKSLISKEYTLLKNVLDNIDSRKKDELVKKVKKKDRDDYRTYLDNQNFYIIYDRYDNQGFSQFKEDVYQLKFVSKFFPFIFFFVSLIITWFSFVRIINKDKKMIGIYKSVGMTNKKIFMSYFCFSLLCSLVGIVVGIILGYICIPKIFVRIYSLVYRFVGIKYTIDYRIIINSALLALVSTLVPTIIVVISIFNTTIVDLINEKHINHNNVSVFNKYKVLNKIGFNNLFNNFNRTIMSFFAISGIVLMLFIAFSIKYSVSNMLIKQFGEVFNVDSQFFYKEEIKNYQVYENKNNVSANKSVYISMLAIIKRFNINYEHISYNVNLIVPDNYDEFNKLFNLSKNGNKVNISDDGILVSTKLAESLNLRVGDNFIYEVDGNEFNFKINGVFDNYWNHFVFIPKTLYVKTVKSLFLPNSLLVKYKTKNVKEMNNNLFDDDLYVSYQSSEDINDTTFDIIKKFDLIIGFIVLSVVILAVIVLYNLYVINYIEYRKDIATLKSIGANNRYVCNYSYRSIFILYCISFVFSIIVGLLIRVTIIKRCELESFMFYRYLDIRIIIFTFFISFGLFEIFYFLNYLRIKHDSIVDILNS